MNTSGLILTSALNTEAQTALASGVEANAKADTLLATALQTSGSNYTGLPDAGITLRDSDSRSSITLTPSSSEIAVNGTIRSAGIGGNAFENAGSSFTVDASGNCTVNELTYTTLNPAVPPSSWVGTATSDLDMANYRINNANGINFNPSVFLQLNRTGTQLETDSAFTCSDNQSTNSISCYNLVDFVPTFYADVSSNAVGTLKQASLTGWGTFNANSITATGTNGYTILNTDGSFKVSDTGSIVSTSLDTGVGNITGGSCVVQGMLQGSYLQIMDGENTTASITTSGDITGNTLFSSTSISSNTSITAGTQMTANTFRILSGSTDTLNIDNVGTVDAYQYTIKSGLASVGQDGTMSCVTINGVQPQFRPENDVYVDKNGSDTGLGSILSPYLTIQKAITILENSLPANVLRVIHVGAGTYAENLTISKPRISIQGEGVSSLPDVGTAITGTITINLTSGLADMHNNNIYIKGFLLNGLIEDSTASVVHRVIIDNCYLYANDRVLYLHPGGDYRAFVSHCTISNDDTAATNPLIECGGSGMVSFNNNQITAKGSAQNVFKLSNTCRIDLFAQNLLTSASTGTNVAIAIFVHNSTQTITIGQNAFVYSSADAKRNTDTASAIYMSSTGSLVVLFNTVGLSGLPTGQMAFYNTGSGVIIFGSNISTSSLAGTSASGISGTLNVNKFAMTSVQ
jgi:hypothetical protein